MSKVIVFGSINMDLSIEADRLPRAGETISGRGYIVNPGGKGANQAVSAARLGAQTVLVGAVGSDLFGDELVPVLEDSGVDCAYVRTLDGESSGVAVILRGEGDNCIVLSAGANHALQPTDVTTDLADLAVPGDVFVTQGECAHETTVAALHEAHERGLFTIYNPAPAWELPASAWGDIDLLCLNETECEALCGIMPGDDESCAAAVSRLQRLGVGQVVLTLGKAGSVGVERREAGTGDCGVDSLLRVPVVPTKVVDTTGAGDTYIGALAAGRVRGMSLLDSMRWGTAASSVKVGRLGAQVAIPTAAEVRAAGWVEPSVR